MQSAGETAEKQPEGQPNSRKTAVLHASGVFLHDGFGGFDGFGGSGAHTCPPLAYPTKYSAKRRP